MEGPASERALRYLVMLAVLASGVVGVVTHRNLYQDGSNYLWQSIHSHSFFTPNRHVAHFVSQFPLVVALKLGVSQLWVLSYLQAFGLIILPFGVWAMALYVLRRHAMFWPMVMVFASTFLNAAFFSIGEYNFATAFMALSFSLLLRGDLGRRSLIALVLSAMMLPFSYEVLVFGGPLLVVMALFRMRAVKAREPVSKSTVVSLWVCVGFYCFATLVSLYFIVFPFDREVRDGAAKFTDVFKTIPQLNISLAVGGLFLLIHSRHRGTQVLKAAILSSVAIVLLRPSLWSEGWQHYQGRTVATTMMVGFLALIAIRAFIDERRPTVHDSQEPEQIRAAFLPALVLFSVQLVPMTVNSVGFDRWVHSFADFVNSHEGVVSNLSMTLEVEHTYSYVSPYTNPYLSVLVADDNDRAIVLSPGVEVTPETSWMPQHFFLPDHMYVAGSVLARC